MKIDLKQDMKKVDEKIEDTVKKIDKKFNEITSKKIKDVKHFKI